MTRRAAPRLRLRGRLGLALIAAGLLPLTAGVLLTVDQSRTRAVQDARTRSAERSRAVSVDLSRTFQSWHSELLIAANSDILAHWYTDPAERRQLRPTLEQTLLRLHEIQPNVIDEVCFIDVKGPEQARVVGPQIAATGDLSPDESGNPFFAPTFELPVGEVYQAQPYISPDSGRWVVSNSTPISIAGRRVALLHFETNVQGLRDMMASTVGAGARGRIVDVRSGLVIADTRDPHAVGNQKLAVYRPTSMTGMVEAQEAVSISGANANHWKVIVDVPVASAFTGSMARQLGLLVGVMLLLLGVWAWWIARGLTQPIARLQVALRRLADGDLRHRLVERRRDELGDLADTFNAVTEQLSTPVRQIRNSADVLSNSAAELDRISDALASGGTEAAARTESIRDAAGVVSTRTGDVLARTAELSAATDSITSEAATAVEVAESGAAAAEQAATVMQSMMNAAKHIEQVVAVIEEISAETNLLALNASIEAARAGESGRGFAIVATEVKELAVRTGQSTGHVREQISALRGAAAEVAAAISGFSDQVGAVNTSQQAIRGTISDSAVLMAGMASAVQDMNNRLDAVNREVNDVHAVSVQTVAGVQRAKQAASQLAGMAVDLQQLVAQFDVSAN